MDQSRRITVVLGLHGIGKSAVAKNATHYMLERKYFTGGVIVINLKGIRDFRLLVQQIQKVILKNIDPISN